MHTIAQCLNYPDGTPVDSVQGILSKVYPTKSIPGQYGTRTVQNAEFSDIGGNKIALSVWEHPDLTELQGRDLILTSLKSGKNSGVVVKHESYVVKKDGPDKGKTKTKICLSVNKTGVFQNVEVHSGPAPSQPNQSIDVTEAVEINIKADKRPIEGVLAGMAINKACDFLVASGEGPDPKRIYEVASDIIRVSQHIQKGNLHDKTVGNKPLVEKNPSPVQEKSSPSEAPDDEDRPF